MINIFEKLHTLTESLNKPNKNYWENNDVAWDKQAKAPNGETFNEQAMYESIRQSDIKRLLKFG
ncbi:MAG: hypothetical protein IJH39_11250 [Clostridia bacterium]|nr:hypothetical protein [Clostridia bacterium]